MPRLASTNTLRKSQMKSFLLKNPEYTKTDFDLFWKAFRKEFVEPQGIAERNRLYLFFIKQIMKRQFRKVCTQIFVVFPPVDTSRLERLYRNNADEIA